MWIRQEPKLRAAVKGARGTDAATLPSHLFATQHADSDTTRHHTTKFFFTIKRQKGKGKVIPLQARCGPEGG